MKRRTNLATIGDCIRLVCKTLADMAEAMQHDHPKFATTYYPRPEEVC
jgi:hypothetical protein